MKWRERIKLAWFVLSKGCLPAIPYNLSRWEIVEVLENGKYGRRITSFIHERHADDFLQRSTLGNFAKVRLIGYYQKQPSK